MAAASPLLDHCPPTLPASAYRDPDRHAAELRAIWHRDWICLGRAADVAPGTMRRIDVAGAPVLLLRDREGALAAFHNACRHRGAELCGAEPRPLGRLVTCPYHAWAYEAATGHLVATGPARPTPDFRGEDHGLRPVRLTTWAGFLFASLAGDPPPLRADVPLSTLDNWPMAGLVTGHRLETEIACNWKVFWENYSECLHCPGVHPALCAMVPVYGAGIMAAAEDPARAPAGAPLRAGAVSWTPDGQACGPAFPGLTEAEREAGFTFVTLWPSAYVVAHLDHLRTVRLMPTGPATTRLVAEWLFAPATLAQPGFDAAAVAAFATTVLTEDAAVCEMTQRGLASPAHDRGTLMPEEYEIHAFHRWVEDRLQTAGDVP